MNKLTFKGQAIEVEGTFPQVGEQAPDFTLIDNALSSISRKDLLGKKAVLNIFPSIDTPVCATQLRTFNHQLSGMKDVTLLFSSLDLPFAYNRFCAAEGIENIITASDYKLSSLAANYGVKMKNGPLGGLYARAVIILNEAHEIIYAERVNEVTDEPNYDAALAVLASS
ncbi:thiol peroxidase [Colwellia sp. MSW7]|uniref:Thiol peroxidase n=1 Tax=Colwellia maritima TaxID=2912588 RepID=A0ABS9WWP4_9GAMM|nr:thiol peroxidase [Colwellia maritima]MCI2282349.1 thiol peroxidase [Colwellia maritima]